MSVKWECLNCKKRAYAYCADGGTISVCTAENFATNGYAFRAVYHPNYDDDFKCEKKEPYTVGSYPFPYIKQIGCLMYCTASCDIVDGLGNPIERYNERRTE